MKPLTDLHTPQFPDRHQNIKQCDPTPSVLPDMDTTTLHKLNQLYQQWGDADDKRRSIDFDDASYPQQRAVVYSLHDEMVSLFPQPTPENQLPSQEIQCLKFISQKSFQGVHESFQELDDSLATLDKTVDGFVENAQQLSQTIAEYTRFVVEHKRQTGPVFVRQHYRRKPIPFGNGRRPNSW